MKGPSKKAWRAGAVKGSQSGPTKAPFQVGVRHSGAATWSGTQTGLDEDDSEEGKTSPDQLRRRTGQESPVCSHHVHHYKKQQRREPYEVEKAFLTTASFNEFRKTSFTLKTNKQKTNQQKKTEVKSQRVIERKKEDKKQNSIPTDNESMPEVGQKYNIL